jgi:hypothetical protein
MPTLVHGVDISTLEGWMVKINSNPSLFGKSFSRRWFRVSFVPAGSDQKLIISYSTNKYVLLTVSDFADTLRRLTQVLLPTQDFQGAARVAVH